MKGGAEGEEGGGERGVEDMEQGAEAEEGLAEEM